MGAADPAYVGTKFSDSTELDSAAIGLPAGIIAAGRFDPNSHVYTPPGAVITKLKARLAQAVTGAGRAKLATTGASKAAGYNGSGSVRGSGDSTTLLRNLLGDLGYPVSEGNMPFMDNTAGDSRITTLTGTWAYGGNGSPAGSAGSEVYFAGLTGAVLGVTSTKPYDHLFVAVSAAEHAFTLKVDGVLVTTGITVTHGTASGGTVTPDGTATFCTVIVTGLTLAAHVVTVTVTGTDIVIFQIEGYTTTSLSVGNFGSSGTTSAMWADTSSAWYTLLNQVLEWAPDVVIFDLDIAANDWNTGKALGTAEATILAGTLSSCETAIAALKAGGAEVILHTPGPFLVPTGGLAPPLTFWQNLYALADATGCVMTDLNHRWGSAQAVPLANGLLGTDSFHPNGSGYEDITQGLLDMVDVGPAGLPSPLPVNTVQASGSAQTIPSPAVSQFSLITLTANCAITMPTAQQGAKLTIVLKQDGTGSRTATWTGMTWASGTAPTLTTTAAKSDVITAICVDGAHWLGFLAGLNF